MNTPKKLFNCPICKVVTPRESEDFPFCSARCKTIDLGRWASDAYRIGEDDTDDDLHRVIH